MSNGSLGIQIAPEGQIGPEANPDRRVWVEVMGQALQDLRWNRDIEGSRELYGRNSDKATAVKWFHSNLKGLGTFITTCELLDLNPECIRNAVFGDPSKGKPARRWKSREYKSRQEPSILNRFDALAPRNLWTGTICRCTKERCEFHNGNPARCKTCYSTFQKQGKLTKGVRAKEIVKALQ